MHILFIANCDTLYGANRSMMDLAIALQNMGQDIFFFVPFQGSGESRQLLKMKMEEWRFTYAFIRYFPSVHSSNDKGLTSRLLRKEINDQSLGKMIKYVSEWKIDIIHTNSLTHIIGALLSIQVRKPHVWHIREALKKDYNFDYDNRLLYKYALKNADKIVCISDYIWETHKKMLMGASAVVLKDGFCVDNYILHGVYNRNRTEYTMLICGVIQEGKGQLEALQAINLLVNKFDVRNIRLRIVGDGSDDYIEQIENYIVRNGLCGYVELLPFQEDLKKIRENTDIALVCSKSEALGRVTVESMLSENLVIGAASGGTKEIIKDGVNGYLYKCGDVDDLCKKIHYAITHWAEQEEIVISAREYAKSNFDITRYAKKIFNLYKSVL